MKKFSDIARLLLVSYMFLTQTINLLFLFVFQAASTPLNPLSFQCGFVKLRIDLLQAFSQLICTCNSLKTSPPPAIATTIAMTSGNDLQRCGRISNQACSLFLSHAVLFGPPVEIRKCSSLIEGMKVRILLSLSFHTGPCFSTAIPSNIHVPMQALIWVYHHI